MNRALLTRALPLAAFALAALVAPTDAVATLFRRPFDNNLSLGYGYDHNGGAAGCQDFACNSTCYDGHRGSDFPLPAYATTGSAGCIGRSADLGAIAPGYQADLALFGLDELRFAGHGDPLAALVLCGAHKADRVMIGGRWTVVDGGIPGLDIAELGRSHQAMARRMAGQN